MRYVICKPQRHFLLRCDAELSENEAVQVCDEHKEGVAVSEDADIAQHLEVRFP